MELAALTQADCITSSEGQRFTLGPLIKRGGAGSVHALREDPAQVVKIYHASAQLDVYQRKLRAMLRLSPQLPDLSHAHGSTVQLAWPNALALDARERFRGFLMPKLDVESHLELEIMLQDRQAREAGLSASLGVRASLAANLAATVGELHRQEHYVVDMKPTNVRFHRHALYVALLDCDGFSIRGEGERFSAPQVTPDYLAPESHGRPLAALDELAQDRFALAVIVFRLLNYGLHPFSGRPLRGHVPTDLPGRIARRCYAYGLEPSAEIAPSPMSFHHWMPSELRLLFDRAFARQPGARPSALEWSRVLQPLGMRGGAQLVSCEKDAAHQHFSGHPCAACAREALLTRAATSAPGPSRVAATERMRSALPASASVAPPSSSVGSSQVPGRDRTFLLIMSIAVIASSALVSAWLVLGAANVSPHGPSFVPAPKRNRRGSAAAEASAKSGLQLPSAPVLTPTLLGSVHRALEAAAVGERAVLERELSVLRSIAKPDPLTVHAARAAAALQRGFLRLKYQHVTPIAASAALKPAQDAAMTAVVTTPGYGFGWSLLAVSLAFEPDVQRTVGAFAIAALVGNPALDPRRLPTFGANEVATERLRILAARGVVAATELGGPGHSLEVQALAERELPEWL